MTYGWLKRLVTHVAVLATVEIAAAGSQDQLVAAAAMVIKDPRIGLMRFAGCGCQARIHRCPSIQRLLAEHADLFGVRNPAADV